MLLDKIVQSLQLNVRACENRLQNEVLSAYVGDLLSDVMANSKAGDLWITRQIHQNIVAVASLKDLAGIVMVNGAEPAADTLERAVKENIPIMVSDMTAFEVIGRIYKLIDTADARTI